MNSYLKLTKFVTGKVAAHGAGLITAYAIGTLLPFPVKDLPLFKKVAVYTGAAVIGMIVKEAVEDKVDDVFDRGWELYTKIQAGLKKASDS